MYTQSDCYVMLESAKDKKTTRITRIYINVYNRTFVAFAITVICKTNS